MPEVPSSLRSLIDAGVGLARRTASGRLAMGRAAGVAYPDLLPELIREPVRAELEAALAATAVPLDRKALEKTLKSAWGKGPDKVLDDFDEEPLSVSSIAQVHAAEADGRRVALKVGRPGVGQTVRSELALLDILTVPLGAVFRALDVSATLREVREAAMDELDLEHEGDQQQRVRRALRRVEGVVVPDVDTDLTTPDVLVTEFLDGPTLDRAIAEDPEAVARRLVAAHLTAWREAGIICTDPRATHVVHLAGGETGLLGVGVGRSAPRERAAAGAEAFAALSEEDPDRFVVAVSEGLGVLPADAARDAHAILRDVLGELATGPARLDGPALAAAAERAFGRIGDLLRLGAQATPEPSDIAALRMLGQLAAVLSRLEVTEDWAALVLEASAA